MRKEDIMVKLSIEERTLEALMQYVLTIMLSVEIRKAKGWNSELEEAREEGALTVLYLMLLGFGCKTGTTASELGNKIRSSVSRWDMMTFDTLQQPAQEILGKLLYPHTVV